MHACRRIDWQTLTRSHCPTSGTTLGSDRSIGWDGHAGQPGLGLLEAGCRRAHHCGRVAHVFGRCSVFPGVSVLVLLRFYFLSRPSRPCVPPCFEGGACGCLIGPSFQYWVGPPAPTCSRTPPFCLSPISLHPSCCCSDAMSRCASCKRPVSPPISAVSIQAKSFKGLGNMFASGG